ncbi:MAG: ubiquinol-cytochrome c reductase iron-sulfur subunit [bacterium]
MTRRGFFEKFVAALFGASGLAFLAPALAYLYPNRNFISGTREFLDVNGKPLTAEELNEGEHRTALVQGSPVILFRRNGELIAFSAVCTHLGCTVAFLPEDEVFECPCHGGEYDLDGNVLDGPPPKPLPRLKVRVEGGKVLIA